MLTECRAPMRQRPLRLAVLGILLGVTATTLLFLPARFVDEGWYAMRAWRWLQTGQPFGVPGAVPWDRYDYYPWPLTALDAWGMALLGPQLLAVRLVALLGGAALLIAVWRLAAAIPGANRAWWALAVLLLTPAFLVSAHLGRPDGWVAAAGYGSLALICTRSARRPLYWALAGGVLGLAPMLHPNSLLFVPVVLALSVLEAREAPAGVGPWAALGGGLAGGFIITGALQSLPFPDPVAALTHLGPGRRACLRCCGWICWPP